MKGVQHFDLEKFKRGEVLGIADVAELSNGQFLVFTSKPPEFFIVESHNKRVKHIDGGGMGSIGLSLTLLPGYDEKNYPFLLVKEDTAISLFNPIDNTFQMICKI